MTTAAAEKRRERSQKRDSFMFFVAAGVSMAIMLWMTLAFFREEFGFRDVAMETIIFSLGIIAAYVGHRKTLQYKDECAEDKEHRPGEWIFAVSLVWGFIMLSLHQVDILERMWDIGLAKPAHFHLFFYGLGTIFGGNAFSDFLLNFMSARKNTEEATRP